MLMLGAGLILFFGLVYEQLDPTYYDPLWMRVAWSASMLTMAALTYVRRIQMKLVQVLGVVLAPGLYTYALWLSLRNNLDLVWVSGMYIVLFGTSVTMNFAMQRKRDVALTSVLTAIVATAMLGYYRPVKGDMVLLTTYSFLVILYVVAAYRIHTDRRIVGQQVQLHAALEAARDASRAKSVFLATMSHEIRTPMNGVIGMTSLLLETPLNHEQKEFVRTLRSSGEGLLSLINDILDFSKIEADKLTLEARPFEVRHAVDGAVDLVAVAAAEKGLDLIAYVHPDVSSRILGDETRLKQVMVNLLSNAIKFTARGSVVMKVVPAGEGRLSVSVADTGIGIPEDKLATVFESFHQADTSTTRTHGGTGLGLAISQRLVRLMGGTLHAESTVGVGSLFHFTVDAPLAPGAAAPTAPPVLSGRRVLVSAHHPLNRYVLRLALEQSGAEVDEAAVPEDVVLCVRRADDANRPYDLVVAEAFHAWASIASSPRAPRRMLLASVLRARDESMGADSLVHLPLRPAQAVEAAAQALALPTMPLTVERVVPATLPFEGLRVLLAEDNLINQKVALRMLERLGVKAHVANNGRQALDALHHHERDGTPFDVVLMDVQMPELDGLSATRRLRAELSVQPYVVALTANAFSEDRTACLDAGADEYLSKPVDLERLSQALHARPLATSAA